MKYLNVMSLTWWSGAFMVATGVLKALALAYPAFSDPATVAAAFFPGTDPGALVAAGLAVIGFRASPGIAGK